MMRRLWDRASVKVRVWAIIGLVVLFVVAMSAIEANVELTPTTRATTTTRPGEATLRRISQLSDCDALQREFDTAATNHDRYTEQQNLAWMKLTTSYMVAADDRMRYLGCFD